MLNARYLNEQIKQFLQQGLPVISVDAKKKELVGDFKNPGQEWQPQGQPVEVNIHDFPDPHLGKAIPYGIYDIGQNVGWVSVGQDHDTASARSRQFASLVARGGLSYLSPCPTITGQCR